MVASCAVTHTSAVSCELISPVCHYCVHRRRCASDSESKQTELQAKDVVAIEA